MHSLIFLSLGTAAFLAVEEAAKSGEPPQKKELFAQEDWYKSQPGKEQTFVGVVQKAAGGGIGFGRFNPYRLVMTAGKLKEVREIYIGGQQQQLAPYVGKTVKIIGKAVDMEVVGQKHREIWPARLELITGKGASEKPAPR
jgi:hypothetical protein